ncbi:MAG: tripartite tricarboxylate transporter permease [Eubacteriaceae bacterium]
MFENIILGLNTIVDPLNLVYVLFGVTIGITVGAMPGLTSTMGAALVLPFTFFLEPIPAIAMLSALYCGAIYGGSISAILINTPGTGAAAITTLDGYELTRQGEAGKALGVAVVASSLGGLFSVFVLMLVAPQVAKIAISFGAPEYFALSFFGISMVVNLKTGEELKNIIGGLFGIFISTVGIDAMTGYQRFTFNNTDLMNGISFIPVMIGLFAATEFYRQSERTVARSIVHLENISKLPSIIEFWSLRWTILRSAIIGTFIGILPAEGGTVSSFISYNEAKRWSKNPEKFGTGILEGVAAPEAANNAATGGAMIPTMTLGIPGSSTTAVILGGLMIQGMRPGPLLFTSQPKFVYSVFVAMFIANIFFLILGLFGAKVFAQVGKIPLYILNPIILVLCFVGSFSLNNNVADVWIMVIAGFSGYFMKKVGFSGIPIALGMILGEIIEVSFRQTGTLFDNNFAVFFTRPYSAVFMFLAIISLLWPIIIRKISLKKNSSDV